MKIFVILIILIITSNVNGKSLIEEIFDIFLTDYDNPHEYSHNQYPGYHQQNFYPGNYQQNYYPSQFQQYPSYYHQGGKIESR